MTSGVTRIEAASRRQREARPKTVAEQVADRLALAILDGEYHGGERLREVEIAAHYDVSRAPVREAIRALADWGFVTFRPRRGAHVVDLTLDTFADAFNTRAVLMGLAARMLALDPAASTLALLDVRIDELASRVEVDDPVGFARLVSRIGAAVAQGCGSPSLTDLLRKQVRHSIWGVIWRHKALDFHTAARRRASVREWRVLLAAIRAGDGAAAERHQRDIHFTTRDHALKHLRTTSSNTLSPNRKLRTCPEREMRT